MQTSDLIRHLAITDVPEAQGAIKMARTDEVFVPRAAHGIAAAVANDGAKAVALVQVPNLDASVCAAADSPKGGTRAAVHTAHLQPAEQSEWFLPGMCWLLWVSGLTTETDMLIKAYATHL